MFSDPPNRLSGGDSRVAEVGEMADVSSTNGVDATPAVPEGEALLLPDWTTQRRRKTRRGKKLSRAKDRDIYLDEVSDILGSIADKMTCFQNEDEHMNKGKTEVGSKNAGSCCISFAPYSMSVSRHRGKRLLRPVCRPNAPHNTTQFLMEVHADDFHLPFDCEVASMCSAGGNACGNDSSNSSTTVSGYKDLPAYSDIDFEYESPDDIDSQGFFERDFEMVFRNEREDELLSRSKMQLIEDILGLRDYIDTVEGVLHVSAPASDQLDKEVSSGFEDASSDVSKLLSELQELKRQNEELRAENKLLALKPRTENLQRTACEV
ncbi:hypothetical protein NP493_1g04005 [Ridgeia piscesae]|uniref:Uncharacterized protein n=1 Tax=Ridgeia piscesae TaxID=27915 RepID=A0AAD9PG70_RIDPI|nr:hypothetical protein NP493_1g04005 [Ridgeia piscesae]